jgi:hypothetical protein
MPMLFFAGNDVIAFIGFIVVFFFLGILMLIYRCVTLNLDDCTYFVVNAMECMIYVIFFESL